MVGIFYTRGDIELDDIDDLLGESICNLYKIAKDYIEQGENKKYYRCFIKVAKELEEQKQQQDQMC